jgi:hypothetical protein
MAPQSSSDLPRTVHQGLNQAFDSIRDRLDPKIRHDMDRYACNASIWLGMYSASLAGWSDVEGELFDLACRVEARIRDEVTS